MAVFYFTNGESLNILFKKTAGGNQMLNIDREHVDEVFQRYADEYDQSDIKIKLKVDHTYRVAAMCDAISDSLEMTGLDKDLAWFCGMMHDIGRFEQLRRYHTFQDKISCNHAALSADILFKDGKIRDYIEDPSEDSLLEKAIRLHNVYALPKNLSKREYRFCTILRDADKIDILRVNCETPRTEIYDLPEEEFETSAITPAVYEDICSHRSVDRRNSRTGIDFILGHISFVFGLVYPESFRQVKKQGYLKQLMDFQSRNPDTVKKMEHIRAVVEEYIRKKSEEA